MHTTKGRQLCFLSIKLSVDSVLDSMLKFKCFFSEPFKLENNQSLTTCTYLVLLKSGVHPDNLIQMAKYNLPGYMKPTL